MIKIKPFKQALGFCGPASLKMVLNYYGLKVSETKLAKLAQATKAKGTSAKGIIKAANCLGFQAFARKNSSFNEIKSYLKKKIPVIVDWFSGDEGHYSVIVDISKKYIILRDPELKKGIKKISLRDFKRIWFDFPGNYIKSQKDVILREIIIVQKK